MTEKRKLKMQMKSDRQHAWQQARLAKIQGRIATRQLRVQERQATKRNWQAEVTQRKQTRTQERQGTRRHKITEKFGFKEHSVDAQAELKQYALEHGINPELANIETGDEWQQDVARGATSVAGSIVDLFKKPGQQGTPRTDYNTNLTSPSVFAGLTANPMMLIGVVVLLFFMLTGKKR